MYWDPPEAKPDTREISRYTCHTTIAFEMIERELRSSPPSLWTIQLYATQVTIAGKKHDPLGQYASKTTEPLLQVLFTRRKQDVDRFLVQHMDQCGEPKTPGEVVEQIKTAVARWMVEGVA